MKARTGTIVVVGGFGLIGKAILKNLRTKGIPAVVIDVRKGDAPLGPDDLFIQADFSKKEAEESVYGQLQPQQAALSGWINALYPRTAAYGTYNYLDDADDDGIANLALHAGAFYRSCRTAVRLFSGNGGSIVNFGSIYGRMGPDMRIYEGTSIHNAATYAMAKEAVVGLTRYIATSFADRKIRCNAVCPGGVYDKHDEGFVRKYSARVPMGRMAEPEEIATAAVFLATADSGYITGQAMMVDGGLSAW